MKKVVFILLILGMIFPIVSSDVISLNSGGEDDILMGTKTLLFDSNIFVLNDKYLVSHGSKLRTSVNLVSIGDKDKLDVILNYAIKDLAGRIYLTRRETVLVDKEFWGQIIAVIATRISLFADIFCLE